MSNNRKTAVTFKCHSGLLEEVDKQIDNIKYQSRGQFINVAIDHFLSQISFRKKRYFKNGEPSDRCSSCGEKIKEGTTACVNRDGATLCERCWPKYVQDLRKEALRKNMSDIE